MNEIWWNMYIGLYVKYPHYSCQSLMKLEVSGHIFEKYWNIKFNENSSRGSRVVPCGHSDTRDEANSRFSTSYFELKYSSFYSRYSELMSTFYQINMNDEFMSWIKKPALLLHRCESFIDIRLYWFGFYLYIYLFYFIFEELRFIFCVR